MNYVQISGTREQLLAVTTVPGIMLQHRSATEIAPGTWEVKGHISDSAIAPLEALGVTVTVLRANNEIDQHLSSLEDDSDETAIV
jgi:hypothetical protein